MKHVMTEKNKSNKMWGGRFNAGPDALMEEINASVDFDKRLYKQDIEGSQVHALMLAKQGIICLLYTSPSPRDATLSRMPSSA